MSKLSVVIPAYNESEGIAKVIERVLAIRDDLQRQATVAELEVLVIDDGSTDDTAAVVARVAAEASRAGAAIRLIRHGSNRGYGAALQTGFARARGSFLAFLDADGTYPPEELPELTRALRRSRAALVLGDRMRSHDSQMPASRWIGNALLALLASALAGRRIHDCCSGMRVLPASIWRQLRPLPDGLDFTPAMTMRVLHQQLGLCEVVIPYHERIGRSKLKIARDGLRFLATILRETHAQRPGRLWSLGAPVAAAAAGLAVLAAVAVAQSADWTGPALSLLSGGAVLTIALWLAGWALSPRARLACSRLALRSLAPRSERAVAVEEERAP